MPDHPLYVGKSFFSPDYYKPYYDGPAGSAAAWMNNRAAEGYVVASVTSGDALHVLMAHAESLTAQAQKIAEGMR